MSSREKILSAIAANKPALKEMPVPAISEITNYDDKAAKFISTLEGIGGKVQQLKDENELRSIISNEISEGYSILNAIDAGNKAGMMSATELESVHKAYLKATVGVAENGAVWISETQMVNRLLPFICQHLIIVLERKDIVSTMHHAYQQINVFEEGFGAFIAGPSKTADIEQSLVIGAHGARSLTVYLMN
jgi:L-lactate dehydrogenase complex protein LldG